MYNAVLRAGLVALLAAAAVALALEAGPPSQAQDEVVTVEIRNSSFQPPEVTIKAGTTVEWVNMDTPVHTSTSDAGLWDSGGLEGRDRGRFRFTFEQPGRFAYHCEPHPWMTGTIVVEAAAQAATPTATAAPELTPVFTPTSTAVPATPLPTPTAARMMRIYLPLVLHLVRA